MCIIYTYYIYIYIILYILCYIIYILYRLYIYRFVMYIMYICILCIYVYYVYMYIMYIMYICILCIYVYYVYMYIMYICILCIYVYYVYMYIMYICILCILYVYTLYVYIYDCNAATFFGQMSQRLRLLVRKSDWRSLLINLWRCHIKKQVKPGHLKGPHPLTYPPELYRWRQGWRWRTKEDLENKTATFRGKHFHQNPINRKHDCNAATFFGQMSQRLRLLVRKSDWRSLLINLWRCHIKKQVKPGHLKGPHPLTYPSTTKCLGNQVAKCMNQLPGIWLSHQRHELAVGR